MCKFALLVYVCGGAVRVGMGERVEAPRAEAWGFLSLPLIYLTIVTLNNIF